MTPLGNSIDTRFRDFERLTWNSIIERVSLFEHIEINRNTVEELNITGWPSTIERAFSPTNLITYRKLVVTLELSVRLGFQKLRFKFPAYVKADRFELEGYYDSIYRKMLDDRQVFRSELLPAEMLGQPISKAEVLRVFTHTYDWRLEPTCSWYIHTEDEDVIVKRLNIAYKKYKNATDTAKLVEIEDAIYKRYLKNRYPKVRTLLGLPNTPKVSASQPQPTSVIIGNSTPNNDWVDSGQ